MSYEKVIKELATSRQKTLYSFNPEADWNVARFVGEDKYFEYRDLWRKTSSFQIELDFPLQLDFELNTGCNLDCAVCPGGLKSLKHGVQLMDFKMFKDIIDEGISYGVKAVNLNFINEPLLRKDIADFIEYARKKGVLDIMFNTNGTFLNQEISRRLVFSGLTKLSVSLDAFTKETYQKIRIGADFDRVKSNILNFLKIRSQLKSKLPLLKLTYLVTAINYSELEDFLFFWKDKADLVSLQNMENAFEGRQSRKLQQEFGFKDNYSYIDLSYKCPHPFQRMTIRHDGTVLACCSLGGSKELKIGNVKEEHLHQIYQSSFAKGMRTKIKQGEIRTIPQCLKCITNIPFRAFK